MKRSFDPSGTTRAARQALRGLSLCVVLLYSLLSPSNGWAVDLSLPDIEAAPGETVLIPIALTGIGSEPILSLNMDLRFDLGVLPAGSLAADRRGGLTSAWGLAANARQLPDGGSAEGQMLLAGATASSAIVTDGTLLFIQITVPESATIGASSTLSFASILFNNGDPTATTSDGSLTIVGPRLKADFSGHPLEGPVELEVRFEDLSSEGVDSWLWDFGDGETSTETTPRHVYTTAGQYTVALTVSAAAGTDTETKPAYVTVTPDQQAPAIVEGPVARGITSNSAGLFWKTNEAGDSEVVYCGLSFRPRVGNIDELIEGLSAEADEQDVAARLQLGALSLFDRTDCGRILESQMQTNHNVHLDGLSPATVYIYRVRSSDAAGNASRWRGGIFVTRLRPDDVPPKITWGPNATASTHRAQIRWKTNEPGNSFVSISQDPGFAGDIRITDDELVVDHRVWVDVEPGLDYYVRVRSTDASGNSSSLKRTAFRTPRVEDGAPVLLGDPIVIRRTASQAVIFVRTNEPVTISIEYGLTEDYGTSVAGAGLAREQRVLLNQLESRTVYHFRVVAQDAVGNETVSEDYSFITTDTDDTDPAGFVLKPHVLKVLHNQALIAWKTDEDATAVIEFGLDENFGNVVEVAEARRRQQHALTGLSPGTRYYCRVLITDLAGNGPVASAPFRFRTAKQIDDQPPVFVGPARITRRTHNQITVEWKTDEASTSHVDFGVDENLERQASSDELTKRHSITLTHLDAGTTIFLQVSSTDAEGNTASGSVTSATTRNEQTLPAIQILSGPDIVARSATTVVVEWLTDRPSTSAVEYGTTISFDSEAVVLDRSRWHRVVLTGLQPATTYLLQATSGDGDEMSTVSSRVVSVTTRSDLDTKPPKLRHISLAQTTATSALVTWRTNEPAGGWVEVGLGADDYDAVFGGPDLERKQHVLLTGLTPGTRYHYRLRAVDAAGNVTFSDDRTLRTGAAADTRPPRYVQRPTVVVSHGSASFVWRTDESCFGRVVVGTNSTLGTADEELFEEERGGVIHRVTVTGLLAGQRYLFSILSTDLSGNTAIIGDRRRGAGKVLRPDVDDGDISFTTNTEIDVLAPVFTSAPRELSRSDTEVLIGWETDEVSDTRLYLVDETGAEDLVEFVPEHDFSHQALLGGLTPGTTYTVIAASTDPSSNGPARSEALTFTTPVRADTEAPGFTSRPEVVSVSDADATLIWATDEAARGIVRFGTDELDQWLTTPEPAVEQQAQVSGLQPGTTYRYIVEVTDGGGNTASSTSEMSFTTPDVADLQAPALTTTPDVSNLGTVAATISWSTDEGADGFVHFGTAADNLDQVSGSGQVARQHAIDLTNLSPAMTYFYQVSSADAWGNGPTTSASGNFTTPATVGVLSAPTGLGATIGAFGVVDLHWNAADAVGWRVYRSTTGGSFVPIAGPLAQPQYRDRGIAADAGVRYRVAAIAADGTESAPTEHVELQVSLTAGDFDGSGGVDLSDFFVLVERFGRQRSDADFDPTADFNGDGVVSFADFFAFVDLFGANYSAGRPLAVAHQHPAQVTLEVADAEPGRWTVSVHAPESRAWGIQWQYDPTRLRPQITTQADSSAGWLILQDEPGDLIIAGFGNRDDGALARIVFAGLPGAPPGLIRLAGANGIDGQQRPWQAATVSEALLRPSSIALLGNMPNPFNPSTQIRFQLPSETRVWLTIYDALGQRVSRLAGGDLWSAGLHTLAWDGRDGSGHAAASGLYFSVLQTPDTRRTGKLLLLR